MYEDLSHSAVPGAVVVTEAVYEVTDPGVDYLTSHSLSDAVEELGAADVG